VLNVIKLVLHVKQEMDSMIVVPVIHPSNIDSILISYVSV